METHCVDASSGFTGMHTYLRQRAYNPTIRGVDEAVPTLVRPRMTTGRSEFPSTLCVP